MRFEGRRNKPSDVKGGLQIVQRHSFQMEFARSFILKRMIRILGLGFALLWVCTVSAAGQAQAECPNIKMIEPQGLARFGDTFEVRLEPQLTNLENLQVEWKVSAGKIEKGQGTFAIRVLDNSAPPFQPFIINVEATIKGLPHGCTSVYNGTAVVGCCIHYDTLLDEYSVTLPANDQRGRLDNALSELLKNPRQTGYFILRSKKGTTEKQLSQRVRFLKNHIFGFRKFAATRIVIVSDPEPYFDDSVKIYRMPSDLVSSYCGNCRVH